MSCHLFFTSSNMLSTNQFILAHLKRQLQQLVCSLQCTHPLRLACNKKPPKQRVFSLNYSALLCLSTTQMTLPDASSPFYSLHSCNLCPASTSPLVGWSKPPWEEIIYKGGPHHPLRYLHFFDSLMKLTTLSVPSLIHRVSGRQIKSFPSLRKRSFDLDEKSHG